MHARLSHRRSEEVFEEEDEMPHSPAFSPSQPAQQEGGRSYRRDAASKQHLVFVPPRARVSPPSSLSSPTTTARHRGSRQFGSSSTGPQQLQPRRPEMLRLRSTASEKASSPGNVGSPKQLLSLSPSYHSTRSRRISTHSLKEKETLALRSPPHAKPIDNWCVYCYQVVCSLFEVRGKTPPREDESGEWRGHVMMRGGLYECHRLLDHYRNPQVV